VPGCDPPGCAGFGREPFLAGRRLTTVEHVVAEEDTRRERPARCQSSRRSTATRSLGPFAWRGCSAAPPPSPRTSHRTPFRLYKVSSMRSPPPRPGSTVPSSTAPAHGIATSLATSNASRRSGSTSPNSTPPTWICLTQSVTFRTARGWWSSSDTGEAGAKPRSRRSSTAHGRCGPPRR
jgi:hypothetical protein